MSSSDPSLTTPSPHPFVLFFLGGPGSGKGTNCVRLAEEFGFVHISAGDLLRAEGAKDTPLGTQIKSIVNAGNIVPSEITMSLMSQAVAENVDKCAGFLVDGFPRKLDQAEMFERDIVPARRIIYLDCDEDVMVRRLKIRAQETEASGGVVRSDDVDEVVMRRRFENNKRECMPVVDKYTAEGRVERIDVGEGTKDDVYAKIREVVVQLGAKPNA
eukprot:PhM_4_TR12294/c0_g1_i1/m.58768/K13800/CMPK1, UMPK; UMP-CMP kinase